MAVLLASVLYILIGHTPYQHEVQFDLETGGATLSPVNRYIWLALTTLSLPLLWWRRTLILGALKQQWLILALFGWFALTTLWALDPTSAGRRLFLYVLNLIIALALTLGFNSSRRWHRGMAIACAAMVTIDLLSWVLAPKLSMTDIGLAAIHTQKNQLGAAMLFCGLVVGPYIFAPHSRLPRLFWIGIFTAGFILLAASQSKTSLGIMVAAMLLTPLILFVLARPLALLRGILAALTLLILSVALAWLALCTIKGWDPAAPFSGITFTQRTDLWSFVLGEIAKRPFTGAGFDSFWDVDPRVQPSLQGDLWFGSVDIANEAHNGYLDLLATTGVIGLLGALSLLVHWISRSMRMLRRVVIKSNYDEGIDWPSATVLALFPMLLLVHNFMESSYFTANQIFGSLILLAGAEIDLRYRPRSNDSRAALHQRP